MIDATTAGAAFGVMLVIAGLGWAFMNPLRDDAKEVRGEPRSIFPATRDRQRAKARKVKGRYRNWALVSTFVFLAVTGPAVSILFEVRVSRPFIWQKAFLVFVWLGYGVATRRLWTSWKDIDTAL
jgi:hypothetical protein